MAGSELQELETRERGNAARSRVAQWSSLAALVISGLALGLGVYQTRLMQTQARASVWPYVVLGFNFNDQGEHAGFELHVENNGVGPAILRSVHVSFDGTPVRHWSEVFAKLAEHGSKVEASLSGLHAVVIPPSTNRETAVTAFHLLDLDKGKRMFEARERLAIEICYCSIYDDCWVTHWLNAKLDPVAACRESEPEFDY